MQCYVEVNEVFDRHFISVYAMEKLFSLINNSVEKAIDKITPIANTDTNSEMTLKFAIKDAKFAARDAIMSKQQTLKKMQLNYELPYNEWLFDLIRDRLCMLGFSVFHRDKNCPKAPAPINEYIYCKSDILFYHEKFESPMAIEVGQVLFSRLSLDEPNDLDNPTFVDCKGGVAELKVNDIDASAENECFYNMFGEAAKMTSSALWKSCSCCDNVWHISGCPPRHNY